MSFRGLYSAENDENEELEEVRQEWGAIKIKTGSCKQGIGGMKVRKSGAEGKGVECLGMSNGERDLFILPIFLSY